MLNPFPELLVFSFFAPTILRLAAAGVFLYVVYMQYQERESFSKIPFPYIGNRFGTQIMWLTFAVELVIAAMLIAGYYTQIAALLGIITVAKYLYYGRRWPTFAPLSRGTCALLLVILATLLLSGAGAFAYDLPL